MEKIFKCDSITIYFRNKEINQNQPRKGVLENNSPLNLSNR